MIALLALLAATPDATRVVRCGAVPRRGIAERGPDGRWQGRAVDLCRAAAGARDRIDFRPYDATTLPQAMQDDIAFLSDDERARASGPTAGDVIAEAEQILLVPARSSYPNQAAMRDRTICFMIGSAAEDALEAWAEQRHIPIRRLGFQETDEMHDAYAVGRCAAMAVDAADAPADGGDRRLGEPLARTPIRMIRR